MHPSRHPRGERGCKLFPACYANAAPPAPILCSQLLGCGWTRASPSLAMVVMGGDDRMGLQPSL